MWPEGKVSLMPRIRSEEGALHAGSSLPALSPSPSCELSRQPRKTGAQNADMIGLSLRRRNPSSADFPPNSWAFWPVSHSAFHPTPTSFRQKYLQNGWLLNCLHGPQENKGHQSPCKENKNGLMHLGVCKRRTHKIHVACHRAG